MDFDEDPNYLDLDDILAHTQAVSCKFLLDIPGLEFLSPGDSKEEIAKGTEILLPFWLAKTLYTYSMIDIDLPKSYKPSFREVIDAEPGVVDLHRAGPHYYGFGKLLMELRREKGNNLSMYTEEGQRNKYRREEGETLVDRREIASSLIETFHQRRHTILSYSIDPSERQHLRLVDFEKKLDNMEKKVYKLGRQQVEQLKKWNQSHLEVLRNNTIAARLHKKRKLESSSSASSSVR